MIGAGVSMQFKKIPSDFSCGPVDDEVVDSRSNIFQMNKLLEKECCLCGNVWRSEQNHSTYNFLNLILHKIFHFRSFCCDYDVQEMQVGS